MKDQIKSKKGEIFKNILAILFKISRHITKDNNDKYKVLIALIV